MKATLGGTEPPSDELWRPGALNLNIPIQSDHPVKAVDNGASNSNLNKYIDYPVEPMEMTPIQSSSFGGWSNSNSNLVERDDVDKTNTNTVLPVSRLAVAFCGFLLAYSLVAMDQTIIVTALPVIASDFNAVSDLSWIASAFPLSIACLNLFFGKVLTIAPAKTVLLVCIGIFELGSLFCAIAPSVNFLIFGRAVAGAGGGGIWVSINTILTQISTFKQRPILVGLLGAVYAICSIIGPLLGGVFADKVTWRYKLPIGGMGAAIVLFTLPRLPIVHTESLYLPVGGRMSFLKRHSQLNAWSHLDWIGVLLSFVAVTLLLLALQAGGNTKPWSDGAVVAPLVLGILLFIAFGVWEHYQGSRAILPIRLLRRRNVLGSCIQSLLLNWSFSTAVYYLPLFYQIRGHSAERSGLDILPYIISGITFSLGCSVLITVTGHIWPLIFFPPIPATIFFGLLFTVKANTSLARLVGFQIGLGAGLGASIQNHVLIAQAEFIHDPEAVSLVTSLLAFCQILGSAISLAADGAIFSGVLHSQVSKLSDLSPDLRASILESITFISTLPDKFKGPASNAYITAIDNVFLAATVPTAITVFVAFLIERKKISLQQNGDG